MHTNVARFVATVAAADPHDCRLIATSLRRGESGAYCFRHEATLYYSLLALLEDRGGDPAPGDVLVEGERATVARVTVPASPLKRVLVESPHFEKPVRS